jgi:ubiquinone/menaquinone biosynthesis C-methylase UbiE
VLGIDINENAIRTCKRRSKENGIKNTEFLVASVYDTKLNTGDHDLVYSRFLFQHLSKTTDAIMEMSRIAKKEGTLVIEELDHGSWLCYPYEKNLEKLRRTYVKLLRMNGSDPLVARKLYTIFTELGFRPNIGAYTVPVTTDRKPFNNLGVHLAETLEESITGSKLMSNQEFQAMLEGIRRYSRHPHAVVLYAIAFRVWAKNSH